VRVRSEDRMTIMLSRVRNRPSRKRKRKRNKGVERYSGCVMQTCSVREIFSVPYIKHLTLLRDERTRFNAPKTVWDIGGYLGESYSGN
jgi:hypothetical protein